MTGSPVNSVVKILFFLFFSEILLFYCLFVCFTGPFMHFASWWGCVRDNYFLQYIPYFRVNSEAVDNTDYTETFYFTLYNHIIHLYWYENFTQIKKKITYCSDPTGVCGGVVQTDLNHTVCHFPPEKDLNWSYMYFHVFIYILLIIGRVKLTTSGLNRSKISDQIVSE